jgi:uncharacterized protein
MSLAFVDSRAKPAVQQFFPVKMLDLDLNQLCNLHCSFCYFGEKVGDKMPIEVARDALDALFYGNPEKGERRVHGFGGETLLSFDLMKEIVAYGRECEALTGYPFTWGLTSNITMLNVEMVDFFVKNRGQIHVSIDGSPRAHDRTRIRHDGRGSSKEVVAHVPLALQITPEDSARMTIPAKNAQFILESVEFFRSLGFRSAAPVIVSEDSWDNYWGVLDSQLQKVTNWWLKLFAKGEVFRLKFLDDGFQAIVLPKKREKPCGAGRTLLAVGVDGEVSPCHRFSGTMKTGMKLGKLGEKLDFSVLKPFQDFDATKHDWPECRTCEAYFACSGGCPAVNFAHYGRIDRKHPNDCKFTQMAYRHAMFAFEEARAINPGLLTKIYGGTSPGKAPLKPWEMT